MSASAASLARQTFMSIPSCGLGRDGVQRELYSPREVEHILSVSHATLYRLINAKRAMLR